MYVERTRGRALQRLRSTFLRMHPLCRRCELRGNYRAATQLDHIVPLYQGGTDDEANLQGLCDECHADKTAEDTGKQRKSGCNIDGRPTSASHHWNKPPGAAQISAEKRPETDAVPPILAMTGMTKNGLEG